MKNPNEHKVYEMSKRELMNVDGGGNPWADLFWMCGEEIIKGYMASCRTVYRWSLNNHEYTAGRSFNH